jgi:hypothetical protein
MQVGSLVKFKEECLPFLLEPSQIKRYGDKVGVIIEAKGDPKLGAKADPNKLTPYTLFKIHIDGTSLEWFVYHELELVCK